jgi:hypothetical protein
LKVTLQKLDGGGALERTKYFATANIPFLIDLENKSVIEQSVFTQSTSNRRPNGRYIRMRKNVLRAQWMEISLRADSSADTSCSRHFKSCRKIHGRQLKFKVHGTLATAFKGEQLQDSYHVRASAS